MWEWSFAVKLVSLAFVLSFTTLGFHAFTGPTSVVRVVSIYVTIPSVFSLTPDVRAPVYLQSETPSGLETLRGSRRLLVHLHRVCTAAPFLSWRAH